MQCPIDGETLVMTDRHGVEIDYCPKCRGVWLDRGELDKILERAGADSAAPARQPEPRQPDYRDDDRRSGSQDYDRKHHIDHDRRERGYDDRRSDRRYDDDYRHGKKRKESFLSDLFDF